MVLGCAPDPDPGRDNSQQSSLDMTVDETGEGGGDGGVPPASSTPLRSAETFRIVTIEAQNVKRTDGNLAGSAAATVDNSNKVMMGGDAHSAGGTIVSQGEDNSAIHTGDGNTANSGFVVSEKLAKAISAARKSDAARKCDAGTPDAAKKATLPTLVPQPVANPANPKAKKKQETEPDAVPSATYKSILAAKLNKITPPPIPGTGKATANLDCGSFYNTGDNRIRRAVYKENVATLTVSSISFNPVTWECSSCPVKHPILGGEGGASGGGGGRGGQSLSLLTKTSLQFSQQPLVIALPSSELNMGQ
jgi:hypothetical protein